MLIRAYLPKIITALFGGLFIAAGILTFGNALIFDRLFLGILLFTGFVCRKDINVIGIVVIILMQHILEEFAWIYLSNSELVKSFIYIACLFLAYRLRHDKIAKFVFVFIIAVVGIELYWYVTEYVAPQIYWHMSLIGLNLLVRNLIFSRVSISEHYLKKSAKSINLDWTIFRLYGLSILIQVAIVTEYLIRHLANVDSLLVLYHSNAYLMHGIATLAIWAIFNESYKLLLPRLLKA
tara:strand:- start:343 stop:1053 length:711 start_codon:yes stop_codon:yes gene_type:complete